MFPCKETKWTRASAGKKKDRENIVEAYKIIINTTKGKPGTSIFYLWGFCCCVEFFLNAKAEGIRSNLFHVCSKSTNICADCN